MKEISINLTLDASEAMKLLSLVRSDKVIYEQACAQVIKQLAPQLDRAIETLESALED